MVLQMFFRLNRHFHRESIASSCLMLLLIFALNTFNPAAVVAQSSVIGTSARSATMSVSNASVPNSITSAQVSTEAMLSQSVAAIGVRYDEETTAADVFEALGVTVFIDQNLEGVLDGESDMIMKAGVSILASLKFALRTNDATLIVESDGSILVISIDDDNEPDYMRTVTYDVTRLSGSLRHAEVLASAIMQTISSDSWEMNGGGNAALFIYEQNGRILISINQSYNNHVAIRRHFADVSRFGGSVVETRPLIRTRSTNNASATSSVVAVPDQQKTSALRSRRGFARPSSGMQGGMGGGGFRGGVF